MLGSLVCEDLQIHRGGDENAIRSVGGRVIENEGVNGDENVNVNVNVMSREMLSSSRILVDRPRVREHANR